MYQDCLSFSLLDCICAAGLVAFLLVRNRCFPVVLIVSTRKVSLQKKKKKPVLTHLFTLAANGCHLNRNIIEVNFFFAIVLKVTLLQTSL